MQMKTPGFTAEASLNLPSGLYNSTLIRDYNKSQREIKAQLAGGFFSGSFGSGTFGTLEDDWICIQGCESARSACLETCEGTWDNPKPSRNCIVCDEQYNACVQGCSRDIA
jgi:hypothetical protein